ncbi:unnamed protein product, partial [Prorocentrum cordatum]
FGSSLPQTIAACNRRARAGRFTSTFVELLSQPAMIPVFLCFLFPFVLPPSFVNLLFGYSFLQFSPYFMLLVGMAMCYFPFGLILISKIQIRGDDNGPDNVDPRAVTEKLAQDSAYIRHCKAAHENMLEGFAFFVAGVLGALQAGVEPATVSSYCMFWFIVRSTYIGCYAFNNDSVAVSAVRTGMFFVVLGIQGRLMYEAAWASTGGSLMLR